MMKLSKPPRKPHLVRSRTVHLAQQGVQRLSPSTIPAQCLTQLLRRVKAPHHSKPPHVAHHLRMDNLAWARRLVLVVVRLRDSHSREALCLARVPHQTQLHPAATLLRHKGMVLQEHVHPRQDTVLACQVLQEVCLHRAAVDLLRNSSLTRCHPLVSPRLKAPPKGGSDRRSLIVLLSYTAFECLFSFFHISFFLGLSPVKVEFIRSLG